MVGLSRVVMTLTLSSCLYGFLMCAGGHVFAEENPVLSTSSTSAGQGQGFVELSDLSSSSLVSTRDAPITSTEGTTVFFVDMLTLSAKGVAVALVIGLGMIVLTGAVVLTVVVVASAGERGALELYLRDRAYVVAGDLALGAGPTIDDIAAWMGLEAQMVGRLGAVLRAQRESFDPLLGAAYHGVVDVEGFIKEIILAMSLDEVLWRQVVESGRVSVFVGRR